MTETALAPKPEETAIVHEDNSDIGEQAGAIALGAHVNVEAGPSGLSELAQEVHSKISKDGIKSRKEELLSRFEASDIQHVDRLWSTWKKALEVPISEWKQAEVQKRRIRDIMDRTYGKSAKAEHYQLERALRDIAPANEILNPTLDYWGGEAHSFAEALTRKSPRIKDGIDRDHDTAPGQDLEATEQDFAMYLGKKTFIASKQLEHSVVGGAEIMLRSTHDESFTVPVANIVSAGAFDHWFGEDKDPFSGPMSGKSYTKANGEHVIGRSEGAIIDYAHRPTPLPALEGISAFVQPNGIVLFKADVSNHRTAAAIARGMTEVEVEGDISIRPIDKNFISLDQTEAA